jgi:dTDP-4-dehydrorhamnose 3,5-epimerase
MNIIPLSIPGCFKIVHQHTIDSRGEFVKLFQSSEYKKLNFDNKILEVYYSRSKKNVIRGLHFQTPPDEQSKLVSCIEGDIVDVLVDIRVGSPHYGRPLKIELSSSHKFSILIPVGIAHGFCVVSDWATMLYHVTSEYSPDSDAGIKWDSISFDWPIIEPILSDRDLSFVSLKNLNSPFQY